tara:strand:+ start:276 stop:518 length:243 start_codon:yes stop_codon:yes gene_type:complete
MKASIEQLEEMEKRIFRQQCDLAIQKAMVKHFLKKKRAEQLTLTDVSVTLICDVEKGTKCKDPFPKYDTGVCRNCFGQSN